VAGRVSLFAQSITCPEVEPYLAHLGLDAEMTRRLPVLARRYLAGMSDQLPCLVPIGDKTTTLEPLSNEELDELTSVGITLFPSHEDSFEQYKWTDTFTLFESHAKAHSLPLPPAEATKLRLLVSAFNAVIANIDGSLTDLENRWHAAFALEDRLPFSGLAQAIYRRYFLDVWKEIRSSLSVASLDAFVEWARNVSHHDPKFGLLRPL
jgi:hypothetical protein